MNEFAHVVVACAALFTLAAMIAAVCEQPWPERCRHRRCLRQATTTLRAEERTPLDDEHVLVRKVSVRCCERHLEWGKALIERQMPPEDSPPGS